ncbi:venom serine protease-like [Contarinia nasturtii]|uniref:venom serine protease-like n=1 Tax=Contarinia nasturtii TaxID=265458 RepID=UPI0012D3B7A3|nr:venom serine protease-like [Contarinia nasturtii]
MEKMFNKLVLLIFITANAYPNCPTSYYQLTSNQQVTVNSPDYPPYGVRNPSSCQFTVAAPIFHYLSVLCSKGFGNASSPCDPNDSLALLDGATNFDNGNPSIRRYCGNANIALDTTFNSVTIAYSANRFSGYYQCDFRAIPKGGCDCGQRTISRIVGGERAKLNQYPYMVAIMKYGQSSPLGGGGTLISTSVIITAAHVCYQKDPNSIYVSVGRDDLRKDVKYDTLYSQNYDVSQIITHPYYNDQTDANDLAIILTKRFISFNRGVSVACLPGPNKSVYAYDGQRLIGIGFGSYDFSSDYTYYPKAAYVDAYPNDQCAKFYANQATITSADLCTINNANDTCQGDSGGPMILPSYRDFVVAVIKSGNACGTQSPSLNQRIDRSWITSRTPSTSYYCYYEN